MYIMFINFKCERFPRLEFLMRTVKDGELSSYLQGLSMKYKIVKREDHHVIIILGYSSRF